MKTVSKCHLFVFSFSMQEVDMMHLDFTCMTRLKKWNGEFFVQKKCYNAHLKCPRNPIIMFWFIINNYS